jgi:hypothetical protein
MSRFSDLDNYADDFDNASALWWANCERAVEGKRGQKALTVIRDALLALPSKRLVSSTLVDHEGTFCTVGVYVAHKEQLGGKSNEVTVQEMLDKYTRCVCRHKFSDHNAEGCSSQTPDWASQTPKMKPCPCKQYEVECEEGNAEDTADIGEMYGLARVLAWRLAYLNDEELALVSPEVRYERVLDWIERNLKR